MGIIQATSSITGLVGVQPNIIFLNTTDTLATVTTAGYLTNAVKEQLVQINVPTPNHPGGTIAFVNTTTGPAVLSVLVTGIAPNLIYSLVQPTQGGQIFDGNVQAGMNGVAGGFISYPATVLSGDLTIYATASPGGPTGYVTSITNAPLGQSTIFTIPDPGAGTANFILSAAPIAQIITSGNLIVSMGNILSGSSGNAGYLASYSSTMARGFLKIQGVANTGNTITTLSNNAMGQVTTVNIPDPANAIGQLLIGATATPFTANHSLVASGTAGLIADAGYQMKTVAGAAVAGGAAAQTITDAFCTAASNVIGNWNTQANAVTVEKIVPGVGSFVVTSSGDPGVSTFNYIITKTT